MDIHNSTNANEEKIIKIIGSFVPREEITEMWIDNDEFEGENLYKVETHTKNDFHFTDFITKNYELL